MKEARKMVVPSVVTHLSMVSHHRWLVRVLRSSTASATTYLSCSTGRAQSRSPHCCEHTRPRIVSFQDRGGEILWVGATTGRVLPCVSVRNSTDDVAQHPSR